MESSEIISLAVASAKLPLSLALLSWRLIKKEETLGTALQRLGWSTLERRKGPVIWFHANGLGETSTVLPVVYRCLQEYNERVTVLLTTPCLETYKLLGESLPQRVVVLLEPLANALTVGIFLRKWRPQVGVFLDTPFHRELSLMAKAAGVTLALLNAHMPGSKMLEWHVQQTRRRTLEQTLGAYSLIVPRTFDDVGRFRMFGATLGQMPGWSTDLQQAAELGACASRLASQRFKICRALLKRMAKRQLWLAANTVPGEDLVVARTHAALRRQHAGLLTLVAPQGLQVTTTSSSGSGSSSSGSAQRPSASTCTEVVERLVREKRLRVELLSDVLKNPERLTAEVDVVVLDDPEALTPLYSLSEIVLVGGSLLPSVDSACSPAAAAVAGCALLMGPHGAQYRGVAADLNQAAMIASEEVCAAVAQTGAGMRSFAVDGSSGGAETPVGHQHRHCGHREGPGRGGALGSSGGGASVVGGLRERETEVDGAVPGAEVGTPTPTWRELVSRVQLPRLTDRPMTAPPAIPENFRLRSTPPGQPPAAEGSPLGDAMFLLTTSGALFSYARDTPTGPAAESSALPWPFSSAAESGGSMSVSRRSAVARYRWAAANEGSGFGYAWSSDGGDSEAGEQEDERMNCAVLAGEEAHQGAAAECGADLQVVPQEASLQPALPDPSDASAHQAQELAQGKSSSALFAQDPSSPVLATLSGFAVVPPPALWSAFGQISRGSTLDGGPPGRWSVSGRGATRDGSDSECPSSEFKDALDADGEDGGGRDDDGDGDGVDPLVEEPLPGVHAAAQEPAVVALQDEQEPSFSASAPAECVPVSAAEGASGAAEALVPGDQQQKVPGEDVGTLADGFNGPAPAGDLLEVGGVEGDGGPAGLSELPIPVPEMLGGDAGSPSTTGDASMAAFEGSPSSSAPAEEGPACPEVALEEGADVGGSDGLPATADDNAPADVAALPPLGEETVKAADENMAQKDAGTAPRDGEEGGGAEAGDDGDLAAASLVSEAVAARLGVSRCTHVGHLLLCGGDDAVEWLHGAADAITEERLRWQPRRSDPGSSSGPSRQHSSSLSLTEVVQRSLSDSQAAAATSGTGAQTELSDKAEGAGGACGPDVESDGEAAEKGTAPCERVPSQSLGGGGGGVGSRRSAFRVVGSLEDLLPREAWASNDGIHNPAMLRSVDSSAFSGDISVALGGQSPPGSATATREASGVWLNESPQFSRGSFDHYLQAMRLQSMLASPPSRGGRGSAARPVVSRLVPRPDRGRGPQQHGLSSAALAVVDVADVELLDSTPDSPATFAASSSFDAPLLPLPPSPPGTGALQAPTGVDCEVMPRRSSSSAISVSADAAVPVAESGAQAVEKASGSTAVSSGATLKVTTPTRTSSDAPDLSPSGPVDSPISDFEFPEGSAPNDSASGSPTLMATHSIVNSSGGTLNMLHDAGPEHGSSGALGSGSGSDRVGAVHPLTVAAATAAASGQSLTTRSSSSQASSSPSRSSRWPSMAGLDPVSSPVTGSPAGPGAATTGIATGAARSAHLHASPAGSTVSSNNGSTTAATAAATGVNEYLAAVAAATASNNNSNGSGNPNSSGFGDQNAYRWLYGAGAPVAVTAAAAAMRRQGSRENLSCSGPLSAEIAADATVSRAASNIAGTPEALYGSTPSLCTLSSVNSAGPSRMYPVQSIGSWLENLGSLLAQPSKEVKRRQAEHDPLVWYSQQQQQQQQQQLRSGDRGSPGVAPPAAALKGVAPGLRAPMHSPLRDFDDDRGLSINPQALASVKTMLFPAAAPTPYNLPMLPQAPLAAGASPTPAPATDAGSRTPPRPAGSPQIDRVTAAFPARWAAPQQPSSWIAPDVTISPVRAAPHSGPEPWLAPSTVADQSTATDTVAAAGSGNMVVPPRDELSQLLNSPRSPVSPVRTSRALSPVALARMKALALPLGGGGAAASDVPAGSPSCPVKDGLHVGAAASAASVGSDAAADGPAWPLPVPLPNINTPGRELQGRLSAPVRRTSPPSPPLRSVPSGRSEAGAASAAPPGGRRASMDPAMVSPQQPPARASLRGGSHKFLLGPIAAAAGGRGGGAADGGIDSQCSSASSSCPNTPTSRAATNASSPFRNPAEMLLRSQMSANSAFSANTGHSFEESFEAVVRAGPTRSPVRPSAGGASVYNSPYKSPAVSPRVSPFAVAMATGAGGTCFAKSLFAEEEEEEMAAVQGWGEEDDDMPLSPRANSCNVLFSPNPALDAADTIRRPTDPQAQPRQLPALPSLPMLPTVGSRAPAAPSAAMTAPAPTADPLPPPQLPGLAYNKSGSGGLPSAASLPRSPFETGQLAGEPINMPPLGLFTGGNSSKGVALSLRMTGVAAAAATASGGGLAGSGSGSGSIGRIQLDNAPTFACLMEADEEDAGGASPSRLSLSFSPNCEASTRAPRITLSGGPLEVPPVQGSASLSKSVLSQSSGSPSALAAHAASAQEVEQGDKEEGGLAAGGDSHDTSSSEDQGAKAAGGKEASVQQLPAEMPETEANTGRRSSGTNSAGGVGQVTQAIPAATAPAATAAARYESPPRSPEERTRCPRSSQPSASPVKPHLHSTKSSPVPPTYYDDVPCGPLPYMPVLSPQRDTGVKQQPPPPSPSMLSPRASRSTSSAPFSPPDSYVSPCATDPRASPIKVHSVMKRTPYDMPSVFAGASFPSPARAAVSDPEETLYGAYNSAAATSAGGSIFGFGPGPDGLPPSAFASTTVTPLSPKRSSSSTLAGAGLGFVDVPPVRTQAVPPSPRSPAPQRTVPSSPRVGSPWPPQQPQQQQQQQRTRQGSTAGGGWPGCDDGLLATRASAPAGTTALASAGPPPTPRSTRGDTPPGPFADPSVSSGSSSRAAPLDLHSQRSQQQHLWDKARADSRAASAAGTPRSARPLFATVELADPPPLPTSLSSSAYFLREVTASPAQVPRSPRRVTVSPADTHQPFASAASGSGAVSSGIDEGFVEAWQAHFIQGVRGSQGTPRSARVLFPVAPVSAGPAVSVFDPAPSSPSWAGVSRQLFPSAALPTSSSVRGPASGGGSSGSADPLEEVLARMTVQVASPVSPQPRTAQPPPSPRPQPGASPRALTVSAAAGIVAAASSSSSAAAAGEAPASPRAAARRAAARRSSSPLLHAALLQQARKTSTSGEAEPLPATGGHNPAGGSVGGWYGARSDGGGGDAAAGGMPSLQQQQQQQQQPYGGGIAPQRRAFTPQGTGRGVNHARGALPPLPPLPRLCALPLAPALDPQPALASRQSATSSTRPAGPSVWPVLQLPCAPSQGAVPLPAAQYPLPQRDSSNRSVPGGVQLDGDDDGAHPGGGQSADVRRRLFRQSAPGPAVSGLDGTMCWDFPDAGVPLVPVPGAIPLPVMAPAVAQQPLESQFEVVEMEAAELPIETRVGTPLASSCGGGFTHDGFGAAAAASPVPSSPVAHNMYRPSTAPDQGPVRHIAPPSPRQPKPVARGLAGGGVAGGDRTAVPGLTDGGDGDDGEGWYTGPPDASKSRMGSAVGSAAGGGQHTGAGMSGVGTNTPPYHSKTAGPGGAGMGAGPSGPAHGVRQGPAHSGGDVAADWYGSPGLAPTVTRPVVAAGMGFETATSRARAWAGGGAAGSSPLGSASGGGAGRGEEHQLRNMPPGSRYAGQYLIPPAQMACDPRVGPAVWVVANEDELAAALSTLLRDPLERRSRGRAAAQGAAKLASSLVTTMWSVLEEVVINPALQNYVSTCESGSV